MNRFNLLAGLLLARFASVASAQPNCPIVDTNISYPAQPLTYPLLSDQYAVQYKLDSGGWTNAPVRISYYGGTLASPFNPFSGYISNKTSLSFVSIPARPSCDVHLRVTNLSFRFVAADNVSVRPRAKHVPATVAIDGTANLWTTTAADFSGDQFLLWWSDGTNGGSIEALAFFLDPAYNAPTGSVKTITTNTDLTNLGQFDSLIFQGTVSLGGAGNQAYSVPTNITTIFLAPDAWVQGKLRFEYSGGKLKRVYGPGVLDGSRFRYDLRVCDGDQGYESVSWKNPPSTNSVRDTFLLDGIVISDHNHATDDLLVSGVVNNVKSIGWNGVNGGFRLGDNTKASNLFLRCADDSLMMWGTNVTVTNATIWQNYNGGVVNLGWSDNSPGDGCLIDGLYVVKTDWTSPTAPGFNKPSLDSQNNAVIASLMVPGTIFGFFHPPLFRNIQIEDPPRVLFSLKILFPECGEPTGPFAGDCSPVNLTLPSVLNLNIENLCAPASIVSNSIGFQTVPKNFTYEFPAGTTNTFTNSYTFTGVMNVGLTNVILQLPDGTVAPLTSANAKGAGMLITNGDSIQITYGFIPSGCISCLPQLTITSAAKNLILTWPTNFPGFSLEMATNLVSPIVWKTNSRPPVVIGGLNVVTNSTAGMPQFYRLKQ
jgi:hypothetical protein